MTELRIETKDTVETIEFGQRIGTRLHGGAVIAVYGTLGAGKTQFVKGLAVGIEIRDEVASPTFAICVPYSGRLNLLHVDAYRLKHEGELDELELDEARADGSVVVVEWPDGIEHCLPPIDLSVSMTVKDQNCRQIRVHSLSPVGHEIISGIRSILDN